MSTHHTPAPILVTGGTGKTGRRVAARLEQAGHPVRRAARGTDPSFDWTAPDTWPAVLEGIEVAYLCYAPDLSFEGAPEAVGAFARTAVARGVRRAVLLSGRGEPQAQEAEAAVAASGVDLTVIRSSVMAQNFSEDFLIESVRHGRIALPAPGDVGEAVVDADDVADAVVAALLDDAHRGHRTIEVGGPRLLTLPEVATILSDAAGHPVAYEQLTPAAFLAELGTAGLPAWLAMAYTELFTTIMDGRNASLTDGIQTLLGREPRDLGAMAVAAAATGVWDAGVGAGAGRG